MKLKISLEKKWNELKNHRHKLTASYSRAIRELEKHSDEEIKEIFKKLDIGSEIPDRKTATALLQKNLFVYSLFNKLREKCLYVDWNQNDNSWIIFSQLNEISQENLAYFILIEAEKALNLFHLKIERFVNQFRKRGQLIIDLPYPNYTEYRDFEDFQSNQEYKDIKLNEVRHNQGYKTMQKFVLAKSFATLFPKIYRDSIKVYFKIIQKQDESSWRPHPLIKAMWIGYSIMETEKKDGNYMTVSLDEDIPNVNMAFSLLIVKESEDWHFEKIFNLSDNTEYPFSFEFIEKLIRTEVVIERIDGDEIPISSLVEALGKIGLDAKILKNRDVPEAITIAKQYINSGKVQNISQSICDEVVGMNTVSDWKTVGSSARSLIATIYGAEKFRKNVIVINENEGKIHKWKCRELIWTNLINTFFTTV